MARTLPLYDPAPPHADGWHRVTAPGGYESWHFDAEDEAGEVRVVSICSQGSPFDAEYLSRRAAFIRNPTKLSPPLPAAFPSVQFVVCDGDRLVARFAWRYRPDAFDAAPGAPDVRVGPHRVLAGAGGTLALTVADVPAAVASGEGGLVEGRLGADLWFAPRFPSRPVERTIFRRDWAGADHRWVVADPLCAVSGTIRVSVGEAVATREIRIGGRGYYDHRYGSGPIRCPGVRSWMRGRLLGDSRAEAFHLAVPRDSSVQSEFCRVEADASGVRAEDAAPPVLGPVRRAAFGLVYPETIDLGGGHLLGEPMVVEANPFTLRVAYAAPHLGAGRTAFCEVSDRRPLRWTSAGRSVKGAVFEDAT